MNKTDPKKEKPFYADMDEPFRSFHKTMEQFEAKMGWKSLFFAMLKYARKKHPGDGYSFENLKDL